MSDSGNSSTPGSYIKAASGAAQRAYGAVTGDSTYQVKHPSIQDNPQTQRLTNPRTRAKPPNKKPKPNTKPPTQPPN